MGVADPRRIVLCTVPEHVFAWGMFCAIVNTHRNIALSQYVPVPIVETFLYLNSLGMVCEV